MRRDRRATLPVALLLSACLSPEGQPDIRTPGPDFGYIPNSIGIVPQGRLYVEMATEVTSGPAANDRSWGTPVLLRRGIAEDWELRAETRYQHVDADFGTDNGMGPLRTGFKHRISKGGGRALEPAYGFEVELLWPTSSAGHFDDGKVEPQAWVNVDHQTSEDGLFTWNAGFVTPADENGAQHLRGYLAAAYSHFVTRDVQLYGTGSWNQAAANENDPLVFLGVGLYWYFTQRTVLVAGYNEGLTSAAVDGLLTLGFSFAF